MTSSRSLRSMLTSMLAGIRPSRSSEPRRSRHAGQLRFFADGAGNTIIEGNVDNNLGADFQIALHNFTGQLHASDFLL